MSNAARKRMTLVLNEMMEHRDEIKKKVKASKRRTQRLTAELHSLDNDISDVRSALDGLGGPIENEEEDTDAEVA